MHEAIKFVGRELALRVDLALEAGVKADRAVSAASSRAMGGDHRVLAAIWAAGARHDRILDGAGSSEGPMISAVEAKWPAARRMPISHR